MEEVLKQIIENIFPSEDMKNYLLEKVGELRKCQIINMIDGDEEQGRVLWSIDMVPLEKFTKEYMESQRQYICGKRDI